MTDKHEFWWKERKPGERVLWDSKIHLGEAFFNEIINHPVPLDTNILTALKRSSLGLDLYLWLVYRTFTLRAPQRLTWRQVYRQFGAHPAKASNNNTVQALVQGSPRVEEDQAGLAGVELHDGQRGLDPLALDALGFNALGGAKRYCRKDSIGDNFVQGAMTNHEASLLSRNRQSLCRT